MLKHPLCGDIFWSDNGTIQSPSLPVIDECNRQRVIAWVPAIFFWLMMPIFLLYSHRFSLRPFAVPLNWNNLMVLKFSLTYIALIMSIFPMFMELIGFDSCSTVITSKYAFIWIVTFIGMLGAQYICKVRGILTSGILHITWFLFAICCLPEVYAIYKNEHNIPFAGTLIFSIIYMTFIAQCILFTLSDAPARPFYTKGRHPSPELFSSFLSRLTLSWFNSFIKTGKNKDLEMDDLYDLNEGSTSSHLEVLWMKHWGPVINKYYNDLHLCEKNGNAKKPLPPSILLALYRMFKYELITASLLKLCGEILLFGNPFLLHQMINFVSDKTSPLWVGVSYAILMFLASQARSLIINYQFYVMYRIGTKTQTTLTSATFRKTLKLSMIARKDKTIGEIVNIMAIDVDRYQQVAWNILQMISAPLQIIACLIYLVILLGPSAIVGALVMVAFMPLNYYSSGFLKKYETTQMKCKDERIKLCNEILNGIKVIKLYAWELPISEMVEKIRAKELHNIKRFSLIRAAIETLNQSSIFLVTFLTFLTFTLIDRENNALTPQIAFVSMVLMNSLRTPILQIGLWINLIVQVSVSNKRLKDFFVSDEIKEDGVTKIVDTNDIKSAITIDNGQFSWDNLCDSKSNLCNVNLNIDKGQLVIVIGRVGSGKSSLLQAMLGEMPKMNGETTVTINGTIAYAPQTPWILNWTIRENILFGSPYNEKAYHKVLRACTLDKDLPNFPNSDLTEIGEKGINLSGGQKARIGLAVACYSNNSIVLLDDPLAAVDSHVGKHIFDNVIGPEGILRNKTRVLVTNNTALLDKADLIIMMEDSLIRRCGTYENLINDPFFSAFKRDIEKDTGSENSTESDELDFDNISTLSDYDDLSAPLLTSQKIDISEDNDKESSGAIMTKEFLETGSVKMD
uniref:Multidrug resistance-associated protein 1 n=1 Tax=Rhabditophanes sp. KR3021 TaxID=114890 RepID=A0AC35TZL5_9BILA